MRERWFPSIFGAQDELGAMKLQTAAKIKQGSRLVKEGRIFSLAHNLEDGMPVNWFHSDFRYRTFRNSVQARKMLNKLFANTNKVSFMNIRMEMADHTGTHIDGLNHVSIDGLMYNGNVARKLTTRKGTSKLGIETMPPIFSRGILADMTLLQKYRERSVITIDDLRRVLRNEKVEIRKADVLLIYTGWESYWKKNNSKFLSSMPGIGEEAARWLAELGVMAIGSDTQSVEVEPNENAGQEGIVHQLLIAQKGLHLIENMVLSELARERIYEFLFVCSPLKIKGGTGSPVSPIAVV
jgi:kynurenine formamidase